MLVFFFLFFSAASISFSSSPLSNQLKITHRHRIERAADPLGPRIVARFFFARPLHKVNRQRSGGEAGSHFKISHQLHQRRHGLWEPLEVHQLVVGEGEPRLARGDRAVPVYEEVPVLDRGRAAVEDLAEGRDPGGREQPSRDEALREGVVLAVLFLNRVLEEKERERGRERKGEERDGGEFFDLDLDLKKKKKLEKREN